MAVDDPGGAEQSQQAKAAGGCHVGPHAVRQLHYHAEAHCRHHLQISRERKTEIKDDILKVYRICQLVSVRERAAVTE